MSNLIPLVSVVIPTCNRPLLVTRAIWSAFNQTLQNIEVIVVVDGYDQATEEALSRINDHRLRIIQLPESRGGSGARNVGVLEAKGKWVVFLDDDDEWLPQKLEVQLAIAEDSSCPYPVVACAMIERTPRGEYVVPRRFPCTDEPISNYLFVRQGFFHGEGAFITSMLFTSRELMLKVPFKQGLKMVQDVDWLLRALTLEGVGIEYAQQPLGIWHADENRTRVSTDSVWKLSLDWLQSCRNNSLVTPEAYSAFIMNQISPQAAQEERSWVNFRMLLKEAQKHGKPTLTGYLTFIGMWLISKNQRRIIRDFILKKINPVVKSKTPFGDKYNGIKVT